MRSNAVRSRPGPPDFRDPRLSEIAAGVYAVIQPDGGWCLSNSGIVAGPDGTLVIDTMATERRARRLRDLTAAVSNVILSPRTAAVLNTHHHGDHTFGNCVFAPDTTIVAHELTRENMAKTGLGLRQIWPGADWGDIEVTLPSVVYQRSFAFDNLGIPARVEHLGPAHTPDDSVVFLPEHGVLFVGDIVMNGLTPFCLMGSITGSLRAIETLRGYDAATVVPGHGEASGPEIFDEAESYLRWVREIAAEGHAAGLPVLDLARQADLGRFAALGESERLVGNLARAYAELDGAAPGAPVDVPRHFAQLVEYHGGLPDCHA